MSVSDCLRDFIANTPNAFFCVDNLRTILGQADFIELKENDPTAWLKLEKNRNYFVVRNDSSLIAFKMEDANRFNIVATHNDSPSFLIKPNPDIRENGYLKLNTYPYGGIINHSWLDRPLSIAGRVITSDGDRLEKSLVNITRDLLVIPSQAIHINRDGNKNELNPQIDMLPIVSLEDNTSFQDLICQQVLDQGKKVDKVYDYDLYLYNRDYPRTIGLNNEFFMAPRLDDLACVFQGLYSFINSDNHDSINVFCTFNNEEVGSLTPQGADSTFLIDVLSKIKGSYRDAMASLSNSVIVSADNAHAIHPNAAFKSDSTNKVYLNKGIVVKRHNNYSTDGISSSLFKKICDNANIPYQDFVNRSDMSCGATLGKLNQRHIGIDSVDIGMPQLAMHSANEIMGTADLNYMADAILAFYDTTFIKEDEGIKLVKKK